MAETTIALEDNVTIPWRSYVIFGCSLCGSDDIMSNEDDSYCNECKKWMSGVPLTVVPAAGSAGGEGNDLNG